MNNKPIFKDFSEYWGYAQYLSLNQRDIICSNLKESERKSLEMSYKEGGWEDMEMRDQINRMVDEIKEDMNIDLIYNRVTILMGKSVYMKRSEWDYIQDTFSHFNPKHTHFILGNIYAESLDRKVVLLCKTNVCR